LAGPALEKKVEALYPFLPLQTPFHAAGSSLAIKITVLGIFFHFLLRSFLKLDPNQDLNMSGLIHQNLSIASEKEFYIL